MLMSLSRIKCTHFHINISRRENWKCWSQGTFLTLNEWRVFQPPSGPNLKQCASTLPYLQIGVLRTALHWVNIQLISGYTLILQHCLIHTGVLSRENRTERLQSPQEQSRTRDQLEDALYIKRQGSGFTLLSLFFFLCLFVCLFVFCWTTVCLEWT